MENLLPTATQIAELLIQRTETLAVAESSAGGLISAALLAVPGASAYFLGGTVVYTRAARASLLGISKADLAGMRPSTEPYALLLARAARDRLATTWAVGETGATGPTGNRYGDAAGHACLAVVGPTEHSRTLETGRADRVANMDAFAAAALTLVLIVAGGLVTNTDSGLACPDWPTCFGSPMPKMVGGVLVEHTHRLLATAVGLCTLGLCVGTLPRRKWLVLCGLFAPVLLGAAFVAAHAHQRDGAAPAGLVLLVLACFAGCGWV
ncbi:MAG TPA: COX15/CtaA family protein, partial [Phenylobacterium sp.]